MENKSNFRRFSLILSISLFILLASSPTDAQIVYPCAQSAEYPCKEVTPSYIEASTDLGLTGDGAFSPVTLPFPFTFYGVTYNTANVRTNGFLSFVDTSSAIDNPVYFPTSGSGLPTSPNGAIYAFWDYLAVNAYVGASVRTQTLGTAPNRQFVIEWRNVTFADGWGTPFDFEIVLHEGTGAILLQYRNIDSATPETGSSATIGLENQAGTAASLLSHNRPAIKSPQFAILFGKAAKDVPVDIKPKRCPNPVNLARKGVLRVAILGTRDVPVSAIDPNSVTLQGIAPRRWRLEDVGTPYEPFVGKTDIYNCNNLGPDGNPDLIFKFDTEDVVATQGALSAVQAGQAFLLKLDGKLLDGTEIKGEDSVVIIRAHHKKEKDRDGHHKKEKEKDHDKKEKDRDDDREDDDD